VSPLIHNLDSSLVTPRQKRHAFKIESADGHDLVVNPGERTSTHMVQGMADHDFKPPPRSATIDSISNTNNSNPKITINDNKDYHAPPESRPPAGARRTPALQ
jgi:hypothetical protein